MATKELRLVLTVKDSTERLRSFEMPWATPGRRLGERWRSCGAPRCREGDARDIRRGRSPRDRPGRGGAASRRPGPGGFQVAHCEKVAGDLAAAVRGFSAVRSSLRGRSQRPRHRSRRHPADPLCVRSVRARGRLRQANGWVSAPDSQRDRVLNLTLPKSLSAPNLLRLHLESRE